ncbi:MAG: hypothetical protein ACR2M0_00285 [Chloroflexia bacterium]
MKGYELAGLLLRPRRIQQQAGDQALAPTNVLPGAPSSGSASSAPATQPPAGYSEPPSPYPGLEKSPGLVPRGSPTSGPAFNDALARAQQSSPTTGFPLWPVEVGLGLLALILLGASFFVRSGTNLAAAYWLLRSFGAKRHSRLFWYTWEWIAHLTRSLRNWFPTPQGSNSRT